MKALFLVLNFIIALPLLAADLYYLKPESIDLSDFPAPPAISTEADKSDLNAVLEWQSVRTKADCDRAAFEAEGLATSFFGEPYGPLSTMEAQKLVEFQERLFNEINFFSRILKTKFSRQRPFDRSTAITPCIPFQRSNSYPSGHAAISYLAGHAFALIYPELEEQFYQRGEQVALDRVIGGVHHPLDVETGKILGKKVFDALMTNEKFLSDLKSLR